MIPVDDDDLGSRQPHGQQSLSPRAAARGRMAPRSRRHRLLYQNGIDLGGLSDRRDLGEDRLLLMEAVVA